MTWSVSGRRMATAMAMAMAMAMASLRMFDFEVWG
jgi:hypothetical protein